MITKLGIIYQDVISLGFLEGLKDRLHCAAQPVLPPLPIGVTQLMTKRHVRVACAYFLKQGVDVVVRFTDADGKPWGDVLREEAKALGGAGFDERVICGVAVNSPEDWLALDSPYLASELQMDVNALRGEKRSDAIKSAVGRAARRDNISSQEVVRRLVARAPGEVIKRWLRDDAFRRLYEDCVRMAGRRECPVNDERKQ